MGLQLKYNGYTFDTETTLVPISRTYMTDQKARRATETQTWNVKTTLRATGQAAITAAINTLEAVLEDNHDLILYESDGTTQTPHKILTADQRGGVKITGVSYPESTGPEWAVQRVAVITFTGIKDLDTITDDVLSFQESMSYRGGGQRQVMHETISGKPQGPYTVATDTIYYATQRGSMTSLAVISAPAPVFPGFEIDGEPILDFTSPYTDGKIIYQLRWEYRFQSAYPLTDLPNSWR